MSVTLSLLLACHADPSEPSGVDGSADSATPGAPEPVAVQAVAPITSTTPVRGLVSYQAGLDRGVEGFMTATAAFLDTDALISAEAMSEGDVCAEVFALDEGATGSPIDLGPQVELALGEDRFTLPQQYGIYTYQPWVTVEGVGLTTGVDLLLDGVSTGVQLAEPVALLDGEASWAQFKASASLSLRWTPSGRPGERIHIIGIVNDGVPHQFICNLADDGRVDVDPGWELGELQSAGLTITRTDSGVFDYPGVGPMFAMTLREKTAWSTLNGD